ncbi:MAG: hypothetical protein RLZZ187_265 [Pseudomonadota bacterium]|jgi:hypothetical protein
MHCKEMQGSPSLMEPNALSAAPRRRRGSNRGALLASVLTFGMGLAVGAPASAQTFYYTNAGFSQAIRNSAYYTLELRAPQQGQSELIQQPPLVINNSTYNTSGLLNQLSLYNDNIWFGTNVYYAAVLNNLQIGVGGSYRAVNFMLGSSNFTNTLRPSVTFRLRVNGGTWQTVTLTDAVTTPGATQNTKQIFIGIINNTSITTIEIEDVNPLQIPNEINILYPQGGIILVPTGPDAANTLLGLQSNAYAVRSVLAQRAAATTYALDYDCSVFDEHGFCVSVGARNTQMGSNYADSGETAGLLTAAYRVTQELRIGGFIDQNLVSNSPTGVTTKNTQPMLGAFAVYQENPNFSGLMIRAALAYQEGDLRITRPQLDNTEPGTGRTRTSALAFGGEIAYGVPLDNTWVAQPYAGVRRSDSQRQGYVETTSDSVTFPLTYNRFGQTVTSGTAGLRLRGAITPEFSLTFGAGMEYDLGSKVDRYAGTSTISGLETFSINASQQQNELRAVGSAGMRYMVASNQAVAFDASIRQLPYGSDPSVTTMVRYSIGF